MDQREIDRLIETLGSSQNGIAELEKFGEPALRRLFEVTEGLAKVPYCGDIRDAFTNRAVALGCLGRCFPEVFLELVKTRPSLKFATILGLGFTGGPRLKAIATGGLKSFGNDWGANYPNS
jgi:hypothetical protein